MESITKIGKVENYNVGGLETVLAHNQPSHLIKLTFNNALIVFIQSFQVNSFSHCSNLLSADVETRGSRGLCMITKPGSVEKQIDFLSRDHQHVTEVQCLNKTGRWSHPIQSSRNNLAAPFTLVTPPFISRPLLRATRSKNSREFLKSEILYFNII